VVMPFEAQSRIERRHTEDLSKPDFSAMAQFIFKKNRLQDTFKANSTTNLMMTSGFDSEKHKP
jgi:hypothetical protein